MIKSTFLFFVLFVFTSYSQQKTDGYCGTFTMGSENNFEFSSVPRPVIQNEVLFDSHPDFIVHCSSGDADYGQLIYEAAEYSYDYYFNIHNWLKPPSDEGRGTDDRYDIYVLYLNDYKGETVPESEFGTGEICPSFIKIDLYLDYYEITVAHEIFHSIQFSYSSIDLLPWFGEGTATFMGASVFPNTGEEMRFFNDPEYNMENPLNYPEYPLNRTRFESSDYYRYATFIFAKFLSEWKNSSTIIKEIFEYLSDDSIDEITTAIDLVLQQNYNSNFAEALVYYAEWRYFTGERDDGLHFNDADQFPTATIGVSTLNGQVYSFGGCQFMVNTVINMDILASFDAQNNFAFWGAIKDK